MKLRKLSSINIISLIRKKGIITYIKGGINKKGNIIS